MSRLDAFINRMSAQRALIDQAQRKLAGMDGVVFELGLGNGRSYDHLRERFSDREIYVFERDVQSHPTCRPPEDHLYLGDIDQTLPKGVADFEGRVAVVHSDLGSHSAEHCARMAKAVSTHIMKAVIPGGMILSDLELDLPDAEKLPLPDGLPPGCYHAYRKPADA